MPSFFEKIKAAFKAAPPMPTTSMGAWGDGMVTWGDVPLSSLLRLPGADKDYAREAGPLHQNSIVAALIQWLGRAFPEAPLEVRQPGPGGKPDAIPDHELALLLRHPNTEYSGRNLQFATALSLVVAGNAYWYKARDNGGRVKELWWLPHQYISPRWKPDAKGFIMDYLYVINGKPMIIPTQDIVHLRYGFDPFQPRMGLSPLAAQLRQIVTDNEASTYMSALLKNMAVPGLIVAPKGQVTINPKDRKELKREIQERYTGDRRGEPMIMSADTSVIPVGFTPEDLALTQVTRDQEARIAAAIGISPMVMGFSSGLERSTFTNYGEARLAAYENCVIPLKMLVAEEMEIQLLPDFYPEEAVPKGVHIDYDWSRVRVLDDQTDKHYKRTVTAVAGGVLTPNEGRVAIGYDPLDQEGADELRLAQGQQSFDGQGRPIGDDKPSGANPKDGDETSRDPAPKNDA